MNKHESPDAPGHCHQLCDFLFQAIRRSPNFLVLAHSTSAMISEKSETIAVQQSKFVVDLSELSCLACEACLPHPSQRIHAIAIVKCHAGTLSVKDDLNILRREIARLLLADRQFQ